MIGIIMGSDSDLPVMKAAAEFLDEMNIPYELTVVSAHRTPDRLVDYAIYSDASVALLIDNSNENQFKILGADEHFDHSLLQGDCPADENAHRSATRGRHCCNERNCCSCTTCCTISPTYGT